ncbi:MAG: phosphotransferase [Alphaproteobacteria bacterium]
MAEDQLANLGAAGPFSATALATLKTRWDAAIDRHAALLDRRAQAGFVRHCHGDLHLRNICLIDGQPVLFDAIEFSEPIACIDVLYDLAFLLMDLTHRGLDRHAWAVFNRYVAATGDLDGLALLPLYQSLRAAIRAHVGLSMAKAQPDAAEARNLEDEAQAYLALALRLAAPAPVRLIAIGGLSGSGKSTLARALAPGSAPCRGRFSFAAIRSASA